MSIQFAPLGSICEFAYGSGLPERERHGGRVPVFGSNGVVGWHDRSITRAPVIVIGRKGSIGEVHYSEVAGWPIDTTYYVDRTKRPCDLTWLYYILSALDLSKLNRAAAVPGLNRNDAYEQLIPLPPLEEQKRIAGILARADRVRQVRRFALQMTDDYLQAVFLRMFGDPVANPMGWELRTIAGVTKSLDSLRVPVKSSDREKMRGRYPYYGASGIIDYVDDYLFDEETLLVAEDGANLLTRSTPIAFVATGKYWVNNHAHVLRPVKINIEYLRCLLNLTNLTPYVTGTAQPKLTADKLSRMQILYPPVEKQTVFANVVSRFERLASRKQEALRQAEHLFDTQLHRAFCGEL